MDKTVDLFTQFVRLFNAYENARDKAMHAVEKQTGFIVDRGITECMKAHEAMMRFIRELAEASDKPAGRLNVDQCMHIMKLVDAYADSIRATYRLGGPVHSTGTRMAIINYLQELRGMTDGPQALRWFALKSADNGTDTRMHDLGRFNTQHEAQQAADKLAGHTVVLLDEKDAADWAQTFNLIK